MYKISDDDDFDSTLEHMKRFYITILNTKKDTKDGYLYKIIAEGTLGQIEQLHQQCRIYLGLDPDEEIK